MRRRLALLFAVLLAASAGARWLDGYLLGVAHRRAAEASAARAPADRRAVEDLRRRRADLERPRDSEDPFE